MWWWSFFLSALLLHFHGVLGEYNDYEYVEEEREYDGTTCEDGFYLPLFFRTKNMITSWRVIFGIIFLLVLLFYILGISIYMNKLMESLETITSLMKRTTVLDPETGEKKEIIVRVWSNGLANLVQAVGSSIPLILLGFAEMLATDFRYGDIVPGAILGSSSVHLLLAMAILICVVPQGQARKVRNLAGFILLAIWTWIIHAWIYSTAAIISYGQIEIWEAVVTFFLFCFTFFSTGMVLTFVGRGSKVETGMEEYKANFALYKSIRDQIVNENPGIEERDILEKAITSGVSRNPKSWAHYWTRVTNKVAGRYVFKTDEENIKPCEEDSSNDSKEKNSVDSIMMRANSGCLFQCSAWVEQFKNLFNFSHLGGRTPLNIFIHIITWPFKLSAAFIPPATFLGGYITFILTILAMFRLVGIVLDLTSLFNCMVGFKNQAFAFLFLPIFFNIPNLAAAIVATKEEESADIPLLSLLASNCFSTTLGFGLPWLASTIYWNSMGESFYILVDSLGCSSALLCSYCFWGFIILLIRRCGFCGFGELGGKFGGKIVSTIFFILMWIGTIISVCLQAYYIDVNPFCL